MSGCDSGNPVFCVGDAVYLRESAIAGFLESYRIDGVQFDNQTKQWAYHVIIRQGGPENSTIIDSYNLHAISNLWFRQDELVVLCDALDLAINKMQTDLNRLQNMRATRCGVDTVET